VAGVGKLMCAPMRAAFNTQTAAQVSHWESGTGNRNEGRLVRVSGHTRK